MTVGTPAPSAPPPDKSSRRRSGRLAGRAWEAERSSKMKSSIIQRRGVRIMRRVLLLAAGLTTLGSFATPVFAEPYWVAYEGNDYPENDGWRRIWIEPIADRWFEDGSLVIDASGSGATDEWYEQYPAVVAPEAGEMFVMQWRLKVEMHSSGWGGADVGIFADDRWGVGFCINDDKIRSIFETSHIANYEPGIYHEFEMLSSDMRCYELYIDGDYAFAGTFWESLISNKIAWGKGTSGPRSVTSWDYFRYGVIPEPSTLILTFALIVGVIDLRSRRH
jgi:hypothetical protein